jgi:Xaa-Pro aminopeptidase
MKTNTLFITNPTNIRYLTGFAGASETEREAYALVIGNQTYLFTNGLYKEEVQMNADKRGYTFVEINRDTPISKALGTILTKEKQKEVGFEEENLTVAELDRLKKNLGDIKLTPTANVIEERRLIKSEEEIANLRLASSITDQCFAFFRKHIKPGITEVRLAGEIEGFIRYKGATLSFAPIVAFNEHSSLPHYVPKGHSPLRRGSIVLLDFGARVNGYCADMTRTIFLGAPSDTYVRGYNAVLAANTKAIELLKKGERSGKALDAAARDCIAQADLPTYPHTLGHGVGLAIHEAPRLTIHDDQMLKDGMAVTIEPGVYIEGSYGVRIEDLVLLKADGVEILSKSDKSLTVL